MNVNGNIMNEEVKVQHYASSHSENDQDDDDEFFGNQSDSYSDYEREHENEHEHGHGHGSLEKHEEQAQRETHKNIGYHEAYDEYKEIKLQQGFEDGYRGTIDDAMKLGMLLGKCVAASVFHVENEDIVKNEDADEDAGVECDEADVGYLETVGIVRRYLEKAQSTTDENIQNITTSTSTNTNTSKTVSDHENDEIRTIMERLEERLRI